MAKFLGNVTIKVDGVSVKTVPDSVEVEFGGMTRKSQMADNTFNYSETPAPSKVTFKILHTQKTGIKALNELADGLIEICTDLGGKIYKQTSATRMGAPIKTESGSGQITVETEGDPINE